jgi:hypothetical protein
MIFLFLKCKAPPKAAGALGQSIAYFNNVMSIEKPRWGNRGRYPDSSHEKNDLKNI